MRPLSALAAALLAAASLGCGESLPPASRVDKLRVLAVRAEPPEVGPGEPARLDALVARPAALDAGRVSFLWLACRQPDGGAVPVACALSPGASPAPFTRPAGETTPDLPRCDAAPDASPCFLSDAASPSYAPTDAAIVAASGVGQIVVTAVIADDEAGGALGCARAALEAGDGVPPDPDHCVIALKRLTVTRAAARNGNPRLRAFTLDDLALRGDARFGLRPDGVADADAPSHTLAATRCDIADVTAECPAGSGAERKPDGRVEPLLVAWFATAGRVAQSRVNFQPSDCEGDCLTMDLPARVTTSWTPPDAASLAASATDGTVRFWAVVRDDRGGVGWTEGAARSRDALE